VQAPRNLEAEQALLGAVIDTPSLIDDLPTLRPSHFYDPVHGRLFDAVKTKQQKLERVDAVILATAFEADEALKQIGGPSYLASLLNDACHPDTAQDYAKVVSDMAARRAIISACQSGIERAGNVSLQDGQEAPRIAAEVEGALQRIEDASAIGAGVYAGKIANNLTARLQSKVDGEDWDLLTFGIKEIDDKLGPIGNNDVIVLGGRTSMGKSAVAQQLAQCIGEQGRGVCFFAMEMSEEQMSARLISSYCSRPLAYTDIIRGNIKKYDMPAILDASEKIGALPIVFDHRGGLRPSEIIAACRKYRRTFKANGIELGLIVLDHIGLMASDEPTQNDYARMSSVARKLKEIAKAVGCAVLACTQINREGEKREGNKPTRADLRDSGHIEEIADAIILCYRPAYYLARSKPGDDKEQAEHDSWHLRLERDKNKLDLIFDKVRMGETGNVEVWFDPATTRMRSANNGARR
jgi:replicative DNA helicase